MMDKGYASWIIVVTCICVIVANCLYRWPLYDMGIEIILKMQSGQNIALDWFFLIITMLIDPTIVFVICILMMILCQKKQKGFVMLVFVLLNTFCAAVLKAYDSDPRPIWTEERVRNIGLYCPVEYGNPSGHSWFSAVFGFGLLLDYRGVGDNYVNVWVSLAAVVLMPLSRMYLGAHSLNQVLEGLLLGLAMCLLYQLKLKTLILQFLQNFRKTPTSKYTLVLLHILSLIPFLLHLHSQLPPAWQQTLHKKCNTTMNEPKLNALMLIVNALLINIATGIGYGYEKLKGSQLGKCYLEGNWQINQQKYQLKVGYGVFVGLEMVCMVGGIAVGGVVGWVLPYWGVVYVAASLGGFASGYVYTAYTCRLLEKYKVIREIVP